MRRRLALPAVVLLALALAACSAALAPLPRALPAVALGAALVWRVEVGAIMFAACYGAIITARLALHGHTYTRIGSAGIEIPQVARVRTDEEMERIVELEASVKELRDTLRAVHERLAAFPDPTDPLLSSSEGDA